MKPRIRLMRIWLGIGAGPMWDCCGQGVNSWGATPKQAYDNWAATLRSAMKPAGNPYVGGNSRLVDLRPWL